MYVGKDLNIQLIWKFARVNLYWTFAISLVAVCLYTFAGFRFIAIPFLPVGTIGTAVAFFIGFKNNQAYDRMWEARKLWGGITNSSRQFAIYLISVMDDHEKASAMLHKHIAWINILRLQLRRHISWATSKENIHQRAVGDKQELEEFDAGLLTILQAHGKEQYYEQLRSRANPANFLLKSQAEQLKSLKKSGGIDAFEHRDLLQILGQFLDLQGGCERIKTTPLFRQYSTFSRYFVKIFIFLLPFGLLRDLQALVSWGAWLTIPFSLLISWVFYTMEQIGEYSENPFDNAINDVPMSTICRNIEADIREMLGEENIPPRLQPVNNLLL